MLSKLHASVQSVQIFLGDIVKFGRVNFKVSVVQTDRIQKVKPRPPPIDT